MNTRKIIGIGLIILGVVALFYQGMTFVIPRDLVDLRFLSVTVNETKTIPLSPIIGLVSLAIGSALIMLSGKEKKEGA